MFNAEMLTRLKELAKRECWCDAKDGMPTVNECAGGNIDDAYEGGVDDGQTTLARELLQDFPSGAILFVEDVEDKDEIRFQTIFDPELPELSDEVPPTPAQCVAITVLQQLKPEDIETEAPPASCPAESPPQPERETTDE